MALLAELDQAERDILWWRIAEALRDTGDELSRLEALNPPVREMLYGPGIAESYRDLRNDLVDLLADDMTYPELITTPGF